MWYSYRQVAEMAVDFASGLLQLDLVTHDENVVLILFVLLRSYNSLVYSLETVFIGQ